MLRSSHSSPSQLSSRRASPSNSIKTTSVDVSVETLIAWLVAAKRSLSSIHHVHRATTLLSEARSTIEGTASLIARTKYLRRALTSQLKVLRAVQYELEGAAHNIKQEINATIQELKNNDTRLHDKINLLKQTTIEAAFKPAVAVNDRAADSEQEQKNTLYDFVDGQPVSDLRLNAQAANTSIQEVRSRIDASIRGLEDNLQRINEVLADRTTTSSSTKSDLQPPSIPKLLSHLERNAHDMAQSLESLVQHFDSCVNAIKHTEGAGAAVVKNFTTDDLPEGVDVEEFQGPAESMSEEERTEMLKVLQNDAAQVDDVVAEIQERGAEMEGQLDTIFTWQDSSELSFREVADAFRLLEKIGDRLPLHMAEVAQFGLHWSGERNKIEDCIAGMEELCEVYGNFLIAYDGMIVEAARRRSVRKRMEKIIQDAQRQLDQLYQDDLNEREHFRAEQGENLPLDIWTGLDVLPAQFAFQRLDIEGQDSVPDLPKETVTNALRRLKAAHGITGDVR